jgi:hypothetical protein
MERWARIVVPGVGYHVTQRGNRGNGVTCRETKTPNFMIHWLLRACSLGLLIAASCQRRSEPPTAPSAPDLTGCTRVEVQYLPSTLESIFPADNDMDLLTPAEENYQKSLETIVVEDKERIDAFVRYIASGSFNGTKHGLGRPVARVHCYQGGKDILSFTVGDAFLITTEGQRFDYPGEGYLHHWRGPLMGVLMALTPQIQGFVLRNICARNIWYTGEPFDEIAEKEADYPVPTQWCDLLVQYRLKMYGSADHPAIFRCPGVSEGRCHYAMNPHCEPHSPPDTVLLFESRPGWNQHGGAELFTFDNHDPRGGLVLFNDGTVKFIRTEEELKQLRWK